MSRDKQIEEMANDHFAKLGKKEKEKQIKEMAGIIDKCYPNAKITNDFLAKILYSAGYRKSQDVAEEIFELIDCAFSPVLVYNGYTVKEYLAELKKKYTGREKEK